LLTTLQLAPIADNSIYQDSTSNSDAKAPFLYAGETLQSSARRALLKFDVSAIPAGATINSVSLTLFVSLVPRSPVAGTMTLHLLQKDWGEGTSTTGSSPGGRGAAASNGDATWTSNFFGTSNWTTPGGDFASTPSASATVGTGNDVQVQWTGAGMAANVQQWLSTPSSNFGWIVIGDEAQPGTARQFDSRENSTTGDTPLLTVNYTAATPPDLTITKSHSDTFRQGDAADHYTIKVNNTGGGATTGLVTVTDTLPTGLTPTAASGTGWQTSISGSTVTATRTDPLAAGASYPTLTVAVSVAANAPASVTNIASVSGGGETNTANDSASDVTAITQVADLTITKSHTGTFNQGDGADHYTITIGNAGAGPTSGQVTVTDSLPAGLTPTAATGTGWQTSISGSTVTATRSDPLAAGASYPALTVTVSIAANAPASVTNTATVAGGGEINTANDSASDVTDIGRVADLAITKSHTDTFRQGDAADNYTITVNNVGNGATTGQVTVTDTLPTGLTPEAANGTGWQTSIVGTTVTATRTDPLAAGGSYPALTVTVSVAANVPASVTNSATVAGGGEINTANDSASDVTAITQVADLTISKSHTGSFQQGDPADTYTIVVHNAGGGATTGLVTVTDTLPTGLTPTTASGTGWQTSIAGSTVTATRTDSLATGVSYSNLTITVSVAANATSVTNTAQVSGGGEINTANDTASDPTTITAASPDLTIAKSHSGTFKQGDTADSYSIVASNVGSLQTTGQVTVTDVLPAGLTFVSAIGTGWTPQINGSTITATRSDTLLAGASYTPLTVTVAVAANAAASISNTATVSGGGEVNMANDSSTNVTTITQVADLTVSKSHSGNFHLGDTADTYTVTVHNIGAGPTSGTVTVTDVLPNGLTPTAVSGTGWNTQINGSTVTATRSDAMAAGGSYPALTITVRVANNAVANLTNTVSVAGGGEVVTNNDSASDQTTISQAADLTIAKSHGGTFRQGDSGDTYSITVTNAGAGATSGTVTVTDTLPTGLTPTAASGSGWNTSISGSTVTATRGDILNAGASYPALSITVKVATNAAASLTNTATVSGGGELNTANDSASDQTAITAMPDLTIAKSHSGTFKQGDTANSYTIAVTNSGSAVTNGTVTVTDVLPSGLTPTAASGTGWATSISGSTVTATRNDALNGGVSYPALTVTVSVAANAAASVTNTATVAGGGEINSANDSASDVTAITQTAQSSLSGFVYLDTANNGQRIISGTTAKPGIAGVTVRLLSRNVQGNFVDVSGKSPVQTAADGSYSFTGLASGDYRIQVTPPANFVDGKGTAGQIGGSTRGTVTQDQIEVQLNSSENGTEYNFAMQGIRTNLISLRLFLASTPPLGTLMQQFVGSTNSKATSAGPRLSAAALTAPSSPKPTAVGVDALFAQHPYLFLTSNH
jgi:uncharacterized repeat protein (TIGR01451 family)